MKEKKKILYKGKRCEISVRDEILEFKREGELPEVEERDITRKEAFPICGRLIGHYSIAGWMRVACNFLKRQENGRNWKKVDKKVKTVLGEIDERVKEADPVREIGLFKG